MFLEGSLPLLPVKVPNSDGVTAPVGWRHFVRIALVRPEDEGTVERRRDVGGARVRHLRVHLEHAAVALGVPVLVEVVHHGDAAPVSMVIVHVTHVMRPVAGVTGHNGTSASTDVHEFPVGVPRVRSAPDLHIGQQVVQLRHEFVYSR